MIRFMIRSIGSIDASMCMYGRVSVHDLPEVLAWRRLSPHIQDVSLRRGQSSVPKSTPLPSLAHSTHHTPAQMMTVFITWHLQQKKSKHRKQAIGKESTIAPKQKKTYFFFEFQRKNTWP